MWNYISEAIMQMLVFLLVAFCVLALSIGTGLIICLSCTYSAWFLLLFLLHPIWMGLLHWGSEEIIWW